MVRYLNGQSKAMSYVPVLFGGFELVSSLCSSLYVYTALIRYDKLALLE